MVRGAFGEDAVTRSILTTFWGGVAAVLLSVAMMSATPVLGQAIEPTNEPEAPTPPDEGGGFELPDLGTVENMGYEAFKALVDGKTLYFSLPDGAHWGREYYIPGTQRSVFIFANGECFNGTWRLEEERYCYYYHPDPSCWLTFYVDERLTVISRRGDVQYVEQIVDDEPLVCGGEVSQAPGRALAGGLAG